MTFRKSKRGLFDVVLYFVLVLMAFSTVYPFVWVLSASLSSPIKVISGQVYLLPVDFTLLAYEVVLRADIIWTGYANTITYTIAGTALNVFLTMLVAYPLSRTRFYGRNVITMFFAFTMFFGGGMIPSYMLMKGLHLLDTRWAMILPGAIAPWYLIIARTYLAANIPDDLVECAGIDGASEFQVVFKIVIPLAKPAVAVLTLFYAVGHWNAFFNAVIYLRDRALMPLQVILQQVVVQQGEKAIAGNVGVAERGLVFETIKYAVIMVATLPIVCVYPFIQKYFVQGIMVGAIKG